MIEDVKKNLELIENLNKERHGHNMKIIDAYNKMDEFEGYLENLINKVNREKYSQDYLREQINTIKITLSMIKHPELEKYANENKSKLGNKIEL